MNCILINDRAAGAQLVESAACNQYYLAAQKIPARGKIGARARGLL
jgi:hypothetical protein